MAHLHVCANAVGVLAVGYISQSVSRAAGEQNGATNDNGISIQREMQGKGEEKRRRVKGKGRESQGTNGEGVEALTLNRGYRVPGSKYRARPSSSPVRDGWPGWPGWLALMNLNE